MFIWYFRARKLLISVNGVSRYCCLSVFDFIRQITIRTAQQWRIIGAFFSTWYASCLTCWNPADVVDIGSAPAQFWQSTRCYSLRHMTTLPWTSTNCLLPWTRSLITFTKQRARNKCAITCPWWPWPSTAHNRESPSKIDADWTHNRRPITHQ